MAYIAAHMENSCTKKCLLQEQCEQSINKILIPDKVLCCIREHNNEETYREPGLLVFGFLAWDSSKVGSTISTAE